MILPSLLLKEIPVDPELWRESANLFAVQNSGKEGARANITPLLMPVTDRRMVFLTCVFLFRNADKHLLENLHRDECGHRTGRDAGTHREPPLRDIPSNMLSSPPYARICC
jgi:hypothetical protein